jgi:NADPH2:quinone reductase
MDLPAEMTAVAAARPGGPEVLELQRLPLPQPGPGEVLIRVAAAGINAPDLGQRRGTYPPPPGASPLIGLEVGGEIAAVGPDIVQWKPGDRVVALTNGGGYAEYVAVPAGQVLPVPRGWSMAAGASLPETVFTIEQTLVMRAGLEAGMTVLIHGAAGGIGGAAIQRVRLAGARALAVVSSPEKAAYATRLGADAVIDRTAADFVARTLELTGGSGADRIVDIVGGALLEQNLRAVAHGGHIVLVSNLAGSHAAFNAGLIMARQATISGSLLRPQSREAKAAIATHLHEHVWPAIAEGRIVRPRIRALPFAAAARAHSLMEDLQNYGKLILLTDWGAGMLRNSDGDNAIEMA